MNTHLSTENDKTASEFSTPSLEEIRKTKENLNLARESSELINLYMKQLNMTMIFFVDEESRMYNSFGKRINISPEEFESLNNILKHNNQLLVEANQEADNILQYSEVIIKQKEDAEKHLASLDHKVAELETKLAVLRGYAELSHNSSSLAEAEL